MLDHIENSTDSLLHASPKEMAITAARLLEEKKGKNVEVYDAERTAPFTDFFVIVTGRSVTHIQALAHDLLRKMAEAGLTECKVEGRGSDTWILLDFSHFIVHIFSREAREFYRLERLFPEESRVELPAFLPPDAET